ncbi:hypothetical protein [Streptococcus loxodontisalivarius]|uniref:PTS transporter n=1 Tax=Streptococcus loxodontisalivarius TaxID=1349415 RepID=A0ABS2PRP9_9STRE|nr:hypothetical protein [Streptococcus loxodontisalivarius]MBM7642718.1 hypothetical protein [Streptococcus loxodontisalivarius]
MSKKKQMTKQIVKSTNSKNFRREMAIKNNLFNRYMLFRYSLAGLFFSNVYWIMIQFYQPSIYITLPILLAVLVIIACAEQFKMYGTKEVYLKYTELALRLQAGLQVLMLVLLWLPGQFAKAFPIFADNSVGHIFIALILVLGFLMVGVNIRRLNQIKKNEDKYYYRFSNIEKLI